MGNIILTNLSSLKNPGDEYTYASDIGDITGIQTNDAPVKYLLSLISSKNQPSANRKDTYLRQHNCRNNTGNREQNIA